MDQKKTGAFLRELRNGKGLTQAELAEQLNTTNRSVSRWETGSTLPDITVLIELAEFYGIGVDEILKGERKSEDADDNVNETLTQVANYSESSSRKRTVRIVILMSALFIVLLAAAVILFGTHTIEVEDIIDPYPCYAQVHIDVKLTDELLSEFILSRMREPEGENAANFAAATVFSSEEISEGHYYSYAWVMETSYSCTANILSENSGSSYPCRFELVQKDGQMAVMNAEMPRDGRLYAEDIPKLFPQYVRERICSVQEDGTVRSLNERLLDAAKKHFGIE